ncbi:MAG: prepilin-type cleavage/methylation domain-containing protein [Chlorogloea purpurea SAG 13.99]|nr:prepilin-type cleavage/methylation domain-containing protein [Chlorogloea purpurea SAG 13.99]
MPKGLTLYELLIALALLMILILICLPFIIRLVAWIRLNIATFQLSQQWKFTRYDATGNGRTPTSLCIAQWNTGQIRYTRISGNNCETALHWESLVSGVDIDRNSSTLRTVAGVAGNGGTIYRVSWADTRGGMGGSWGQLGRLVLVAPGTPDKRCLVLFRVDGSWNIRQDGRC